MRSIAQFADLNVVFDPAFRDDAINVDLRKTTLDDALTSVTASTHTFYRVTRPAHDHDRPRHARRSAASTRNPSSGPSTSATPTSRK